MRNKKYFPMLLAFVVPLLICIGICIGNGVYPFGDNCILHIDLYHQYCPFFTEFMNKLRNGDSLMYTWNIGLGSDFVSVFAYYIASPLNWLIVFCPSDYVIEFMTILIILKIALAGLFFFIFLKEVFEPDRDKQFVAVVFSTAYALCGFVGAYSLDIMWLDGVALAPLAMLGLRRMVKEKKVLLYYVTLSVSILANYYIAMMICIFLVFYFVLLFFEHKQGRWGALGRFIVCSLLAGGTGAVMLLPEMKVLGYSGSQGITFPKAVEWYFNIISELGRMCTTAKVYSGNDHWPNIYSGAFSILLVMLYILNRRISIKHKLPRLAMVGFFLLSFSNNFLDFIWHGFHFPNSLPGRQAFLFSFLILTIGYKEIMEFRGTRIWHIAVSLVVIAGVYVTGAVWTDAEITEIMSFVVTGLFILCYAIIAVLYKVIGRENKGIVAEFVCTIAVVELIVNMAVTGFCVTSRVNYTAKRDDYKEIIKLADEDSNGAFYRLEDTQRMTKNDDCLYGYAAATQFSSLMNINVSHFYQKVYMEGGKNFYGYNGATPLTTALLSVKYFVADSPLYANDLRTLVGQRGNLFLYRNKYCLPMGYMIDEDDVLAFEECKENKLQGLNALAYSLGAETTYMVGANYLIEQKEGCSTITVNDDGYYYAAYTTCTSDQLTVESDDGRKMTYSKTTHPYLIDLGYYKAGSDIRISNSKLESINFNVYKLDMDAFEQAYNKLSEQTLSLQEYSDTYLRGNIDVKESGRLVVPVASEAGWSLYVDGSKTEIVDYADTFISISLDKGEHEIELKYKTPYLVEGAVISGACVLIFILLFVISGRRRGKKND